MAEGEGKILMKNGNIYEGTFYQNEKHGPCKFTIFK